MAELGIEVICAASPQAKGRVERANQTLQDRLVKEMRLAAINDYQQANAFLSDYFPIYNHRFAVQAINPIDYHEPLRPENDLELIFTRRVTRKLSKDLQFQFERVIYQIETDRPAYALQGREVIVCVTESGEITVLLNQMQLTFKRFIRQPKRYEIATGKHVERQSYKPALDHPWRNYGYKINDNPVSAPN